MTARAYGVCAFDLHGELAGFALGQLERYGLEDISRCGKCACGRRTSDKDRAPRYSRPFKTEFPPYGIGTC
jgi:hypothetical protein